MYTFKALLVCLVLGVASAMPGGYLAKGGVYDFKKPLSYMDDAVHAGKMAWNQKFEGESELGAFAEDRGARQAAYVPTFYTAVADQPASVSQPQPVYYHGSLYYNSA